MVFAGTNDELLFFFAKIRNKPATQQDHKPFLKLPHPPGKTDIERLKK